MPRPVVKSTRVALDMNEESKAQEVPNAERLRAAQTTRTLSDFALVRTALSSERSLMSGIRTSVSLYSFGFTIIKFVGYLERQAEGDQLSQGPRRLGFALICIGIVMLLFAAAEHLQRLAKMKQLGLPRVSRISLPVTAAAALFVIGTATLIGIACNWPP